jgi:hypothetical protein
MAPRKEGSPELRTSIFKWLIMPFLFLLGLLAALAQHLFYSYIDGLSPEEFIVEQKWVIRIGTALAYLFKTSLVATTAVVFYHRSWYSFRRQAMSVRGLDAVFGVFENPFWFLTWEMLVKTKVAALLALMSWLLPLTAIFSPASLTGQRPHISMLISSYFEPKHLPTECNSSDGQCSRWLGQLL